MLVATLTNVSIVWSSDYRQVGIPHRARILTICFIRYLVLADVSFGTPAQTFKVRVDSGTSVSWIRGAQKKEYGYSYEAEQGFDSSKSSTYHESGEPYTLSYSNGLTVEGSLNWDVLEFGGLAGMWLRFFLERRKWWGNVS